MKRGVIVAAVLVGCSKAPTPTPAPPVVGVGSVAPPALPPSASAHPAERLGPPVVLDGKAYDADTGAAWPDASTTTAWPPARARNGGVGEEATVATQKDRRFVVGKTRIACLDNKSQVRWTLPPMKRTTSGGADALELPGGDLLIYGWGQTSDSGAELVRVHAEDGKEIFRVDLAPAGVGHSKYWHDVHVRTRGDWLDVVSIGSYATWVEVVSAATGKSHARWKPKSNEKP